MSNHHVKTHLQMRSLVCLICASKNKPSSMRNIVGVLLERVHKFWSADYNQNDEKFPTHICNKCRNLLFAIEFGKKTVNDLPDRIDFSNKVTLPRLTRSTNAENIDELTLCDCYICEIGRKNPGQLGHEGFSKTNVGKSPMIGPARWPVAKSITVCQRCYMILGKGLPHPENCNISDFRNSIQELLKSDPKLVDIITSENIKQKSIEASAADTDTISFATAGGGQKMTIPAYKKGALSITKKSPRKAIYIDSPVSAQSWIDMKSGARLTGQQSTIVAKFVRQWFGRDVLIPFLDQKVYEMTHVLKDYFSTEVCKLDAHNKKIRENQGPVDRVVVYNNRLLATNQLICEKRGVDIKETLFRYGGDCGRGFFKVNGNLIDIKAKVSASETNLESPTKKPKWSYEDGPIASKFLDTGVRQLSMYGKLIV